MKYKENSLADRANRLTGHFRVFIRDYAVRWADRMEKLIDVPEKDFTKEVVLRTVNDPEVVLAGAGLLLAYSFLVQHWLYGKFLEAYYMDLFPDMVKPVSFRRDVIKRLRDRRRG